MIEIQVPQWNKLGEVPHKPAIAGIAEMGDVMDLRSRRRQRATQHLFQAWAVNARSEPIGTHILSCCQVILSRVLHRKALGERAAEARIKPVSIVLHRSLGCVVLFDEVSDDLKNEVFRQSVEVELHRMRRPIATPVVVEIDLYGLKPLIHAISEKILNARIFCERDMRPDIEEEAALVSERSCVPSIVFVLVVHERGNTLRVKSIGGAETGHSRTQDHNIWLWH